MRPERPLNPAVLVTLLCPNPACGKRVAVMDHFPTGKEKVGEIVLIDGTTAKRVDKLFCKRCFASFPPIKAKYPEHVFVNPNEPTRAPRPSDQIIRP